MISVFYLIVFVSLLYSFDKAENFSYITRKLQQYNEHKFSNLLTAENQDEYLAKTVSPYWNLAYDEQLKRKQNRIIAIVDTIVKRSEGFQRGKSYKLLQIIPSPVTKAYRNRDEFNINQGIDGDSKTVGLTVANVLQRRTIAIRPKKIVTIKESHKRVAQVYEDFIRSSPLRPCLQLFDGGHWRSLLVRSNDAGDIMATVIVQPKGFTMKTIQEQQQELKKNFLKHLPNITLFHQQCMYLRCSYKEASYILLYGKPYLMETLNGYKFKISPDSFFQINKLAAEVLYDTIIRTAKLEPKTTVLDICSGAGAISIMASKFVKEAIGVESTSQAVLDAKESAKLNNIHNVQFLGGSPEKNLRIILKRLNRSSDIVIVVNAGIAQLGLDFIRIIRKSPLITRVVYLDTYQSDSPNAVLNYDILCSYKESEVTPFRMTEIIPVDLFPQTADFQLILMFQRS